MKYLLCFLILFGAVSSARSQWTAKARTVEIYFYNQNEWFTWMAADLYHNGVLVPPSTNYYYHWYTISPTGIVDSSTVGYGDSLCHLDGHHDTKYTAYVVISEPPTIPITVCDNIYPELDGMPTKVNFSAEDQSGNYILNQATIENYIGPDYWREALIANDSTWWYLAGGSNANDEYVKIQPNYLSSLTEKFNKWTTSLNATYYDNWLSLEVDTSMHALTCFYGTVYDATIGSQVVDASVSPDSLDFMDPWLIDKNDPTYGMHNQGASAPFYGIAYGTDNIGINSAHQGVLANQTYQDSNKPYYRVRAHAVRIVDGFTAFFSGWSASNANLRDDGISPDGYYYADAEFTSNGAAVTAQYKYCTVTYNTTMPSGTWPMAGSVTIPSGVTLTGSSGATMNFPSSTTLTVNGTLNGNGMILAASSGSWNGITINTSGVSVTNCTIQDAYQAIGITNATTCTITGCTISNSSLSSSQGIEISNSSPTITNLVINGESDTWSGVRYINSSGGTLGNSTIQYLGSGHGIIIQGNSSPTITGNTIEHNTGHHLCL